MIQPVIAVQRVIVMFSLIVLLIQDVQDNGVSSILKLHATVYVSFFSMT